MAHAWRQLVLGGIDTPRLLVIDDNFCNNPYFTSSINGWTLVETGGAIFERVEHDDAYGQYMGHIDKGSNTTDYVTFTFDYGSSIANKTFIFVLDAIGTPTSFGMQFKGSSTFGGSTKAYLDSGRNRYYIIATATSQTGNNITIQIIVGSSDDVWFDNIYFSEVLNDIELSQPDDAGKLIFEKETDGENILWNNNKHEFNAKWNPAYISEYAYLSRSEETNRQLIANAQKLFVIPHKDIAWGFLGRWNAEQYVRKYSFNKYFGHDGIISVFSEEYFFRLPSMYVLS